VFSAERPSDSNLRESKDVVMHFRGWQKRKGVGMRDLWVKFLNDDSGATAIEYGLIAACIAVAIIAILQSLGQASLRACRGSSTFSVPERRPAMMVGRPRKHAQSASSL
jgi:pilus assembly protein Flp/PilA